MNTETKFDGMQNWTNENSREGLNNFFTNIRTGKLEVSSTEYESTFNHILTFMIRDLERARA